MAITRYTLVRCNYGNCHAHFNTHMELTDEEARRMAFNAGWVTLVRGGAETDYCPNHNGRTS